MDTHPNAYRMEAQELENEANRLLSRAANLRERADEIDPPAVEESTPETAPVEKPAKKTVTKKKTAPVEVPPPTPVEDTAPVENTPDPATTEPEVPNPSSEQVTDSVPAAAPQS